VLITVDAGRLFRAEEAGILQPVESEVLNERIPENLRHPDGLWSGLTKRVRAIVRSTERTGEDEIRRYEDLAEPAFEDRVCIRSSSNIYNQSLVASMIESQGPEAAEAWVEGLVANMARPPQGGDRDQIRAVATGECDVAVVNHYYLVRMLEGDDEADREAARAVEIVFPNQDGRGAHANISGAGVVAGAPHPENAVRFLEYLTSVEAQAQFAFGNYEYPVVEGVKLDPALEAFGSFRTDAVNASRYGANNAEAVRMMDRAGWR
ncbi:MAG TPA: extracellular solute-binding protein, partial [Geminicoccaceae bacterium]